MTDNRNRTVAEIRKIFEKHNGVLGAAGTAGWAFDRKGLLSVGKEATEDQLMEVAVGAGADDYQDAGDDWSLTTAPDVLSTVGDALEKAGIKPKSSGLGFCPRARSLSLVGTPKLRSTSRKPSTITTTCSTSTRTSTSPTKNSRSSKGRNRSQS